MAIKPSKLKNKRRTETTEQKPVVKSVSGGYADRVRSKLIQKAATSNGANKLEFSPGVGTHRIRLLPPVTTDAKGKTVEDTEGLFYHTHSYHWIPNDINDIKSKSGKYLWTKKEYVVNGKTMKDPIDEAVSQFYSVGRKEDDQDLLDLGGVLKRKRNYFCDIILYTEEGPEYRILVDRSNEGKLIRLICAIMGLPFWRDVDDNWVEKGSAEIDPDKDYYDLLDVESGHDLKIVKKKTGVKDWDVSYEDTYAMKSSRALEEEEMELLNSRVDLKTYISYEEDFNCVKAEIDKFLEDNEDSSDDDEEEEVDETPVKKSTKKPQTVEEEEEDEEEVEETSDEDDSEIDDLLSELPDEDEE